MINIIPFIDTVTGWSAHPKVCMLRSFSVSSRVTYRGNNKEFVNHAFKVQASSLFSTVASKPQHPSFNLFLKRGQRALYMESLEGS